MKPEPRLPATPSAASAILLSAVLLGAALLAIVPQAGAGTKTSDSDDLLYYDENFDEAAVGAATASEPWYTVPKTAVVGGAAVTAVVSSAGTCVTGVGGTTGKCLRYQPPTGDAFETYMGYHMCGGGNAGCTETTDADLCVAGQYFSASINVETSLALSHRITLGVGRNTAAQGNPGIGMRITGGAGSTETITVFLATTTAETTATATTAFAIASGTADTINLQVSDVDCTPGSGVVKATIAVAVYGGTTPLDFSQILTTNQPSSLGKLGDGNRVSSCGVRTTQPAGPSSGTFPPLYWQHCAWSAVKAPSSSDTSDSKITVTSCTPATGTTGTSVTVAGTYFKTGAQVFFEDEEATVTSTTATSIVVTAPYNSPGLYDVTVKNPDGKGATKIDCFTYTGTAPDLNIVSVTPAQGTKGTIVKVKVDKQGVADPVVMFGTKVAQNGTIANTAGGTTTYTVPAPSNVVGMYSVSVVSSNYATATKTNAFEYLEPTYTPPCPDFAPYNYEGFDLGYYDVDDVPTRCWYRYSTQLFTTNYISDTYYRVPSRVQPDNQGSLQLASASATGQRAQFRLLGYDACQNDRIASWGTSMYLASDTSTAPLYMFGMGTTDFSFGGTASGGFLEFAIGGAASVNIVKDGVKTTSALTYTFAKEKWYRITSSFACRDAENEGTPKFEFCVSVTDSTASSSASQCASVAVGTFQDYTINRHIIGAGTSAGVVNMYVDESLYTYFLALDDRYNAPGGHAFVGMDVNPEGQFLIYRQADGGTQTGEGQGNNVIGSLEASHVTGMVELDTDLNNNCNRAYGVMAARSSGDARKDVPHRDAVAWIGCDDDGANPGETHLHIRDPTNFDLDPGEADYQQIGDCGGHNCLGDDDVDNDEFPDIGSEIFRMAKFPVDYTAESDQSGGIFQQVRLAFAFSESGTGKIGVYLEQQNEAGVDQLAVGKAQFVPQGLTAAQICVVSAKDNEGATGYDADKKDYVVAGLAGYGVSVYEVDWGTESEGITAPKLNKIGIQLGELTQVEGLDCGNHSFAAITATTVYVVQVHPDPGNGDTLTKNAGDFVIPPIVYALGGATPRAVSMTPDGKWIAVGLVQSASFFLDVYNGVTGFREVASTTLKSSFNENNEPFLTQRMGAGATLPDGTDAGPNYVWVMFTDRLVRVPLHPFIADGEFTKDPSPDNGDSDVGCYPDDATRGDGIEDGDDPHWLNCDIDKDGTPDGEDTCVDVDGDGKDTNGDGKADTDCEYNGKDLAEKCQGETTEECEEAQEDADDSLEGLDEVTDPLCDNCDPKFPGLDIAVTASQMGMSIGAVAALICVLLILALGVSLAQLNSGAGYAGAAGACIICVFFELIPIWVPVVFFACALAWILYRRSAVG